MMVNLEFAKKGKFLIHHFVQDIREILKALDDTKRNPYMLVFVALNGETVSQQ